MKFHAKYTFSKKTLTQSSLGDRINNLELYMKTNKNKQIGIFNYGVVLKLQRIKVLIVSFLNIRIIFDLLFSFAK